MAKELVEIEIHEQKEGMTGVFVIREPKGPKGKPDPCSYRPCYLDEEKAKAERLAVLEAREAVWLADARAKEKEFADYKAKTEERLNKLAMLVQQLAGGKS